MKKQIALTLALLLTFCAATQAQILLETEAFKNKGGWMADHQAFTKIQSAYLLAHGLGRPVEDAWTQFDSEKMGRYHVYVSTYNWTSPWYDGKGPGAFEVIVNGKSTGVELGTEGDCWGWQYAGTADLTRTNTVSLHDKTGFDGRADAIYFTLEQKAPEADYLKFSRERQALLGNSKESKHGGFDLVVVGGGVAGCTMALTAADEGLKVALVDNLPWLGGNYALGVKPCGLLSENLYPNLGYATCRIIGALPEAKNDRGEYFIRDNGSGYINCKGKIPGWAAIENQIEETDLLYGLRRLSNEEKAHLSADEKRQNSNEYRRRKFSHMREQLLVGAGVKVFKDINVFALEKNGDQIASVTGRSLKDGKDHIFSGTYFADCTGDGVLGYLAGAEFMIGREGKEYANEPTAPEVGDMSKMGASMHWYAYPRELSGKFPTIEEIPWAMPVTEENYQKGSQWGWEWETGLYADNAQEAELVRDNYLRAVYGNWSFLKNNVERYANYRLDYLQHIAMKRESRRIVGGYVLNENDIRDKVEYPDASFTTTWPMDLHYATGRNGKAFGEWAWYVYNTNEPEIWVFSYHVPYRCLYSKDVPNLFLGGRNISVTHQALGTVRVQSTLGMAGEVAGLAAKICKKHKAQPKDVYDKYLDELKALMKRGTN